MSRSESQVESSCRNLTQVNKVLKVSIEQDVKYKVEKTTILKVKQFCRDQKWRCVTTELVGRDRLGLGNCTTRLSRVTAQGSPKWRCGVATKPVGRVRLGLAEPRKCWRVDRVLQDGATLHPCDAKRRTRTATCSESAHVRCERALCTHDNWNKTQRWKSS